MDNTLPKSLEFRRKFFKLAGASIDITDLATNQLVGFIQMKAFKLKEDIRVFTDKTKSTQIMSIKARNVIDLSSTYDVFDNNGQAVLTFKRKALRSAFVRDHWDIFNGQGQPIGTIEETSSELAIIRRWIGVVPIAGAIAEIVFAFVEQEYTVADANKAKVAIITHRKSPVVTRLRLNVIGESPLLIPQTGFAATTLLTAIEEEKN